MHIRRFLSETISQRRIFIADVEREKRESTLSLFRAEESKKRFNTFYTKVLATLGYTQTMEHGEAAGFNDSKTKNTDFWIAKNEKGVVPLHLAFEAKSQEEVGAFYDAALAAGATDNGAPGYRTDYWPGYYAAFVHDRDGHNIEAVYYDYSKTE